MAVEGVNNNRHTGLWTAGGMLAGAGAGVTTAYLSNPAIKNGAPTDEFVRTVIVNNANIGVKDAVQFDEGLEFVQKFVKTDNAEKLKKLCESYFKNLPENIISKSEIDLAKEKLANINETNFANVKEEILKIFGNPQEELIDINKMIKSYWDVDKKKFVGSGELFDTIKDSLNGLRLKNAVKYGIVGAIAAGIAGFAISKTKNS